MRVFQTAVLIKRQSFFKYCLAHSLARFSNVFVLISECSQPISALGSGAPSEDTSSAFPLPRDMH